MKTKILLLFILIFSLGASCEPEDTAINECNCEKVYYLYKVRLDGVQATWYYQKTYSEPTALNCNDESGQYVQIGSNEYYRIECE